MSEMVPPELSPYKAAPPAIWPGPTPLAKDLPLIDPAQFLINGIGFYSAGYTPSAAVELLEKNGAQHVPGRPGVFLLADALAALGSCIRAAWRDEARMLFYIQTEAARIQYLAALEQLESEKEVRAALRRMFIGGKAPVRRPKRKDYKRAKILPPGVTWDDVCRRASELRNDAAAVDVGDSSK